MFRIKGYSLQLTFMESSPKPLSYMCFNFSGVSDIMFLDSACYVKISLTTKSILLPSVEILVVLGEFLLLL